MCGIAGIILHRGAGDATRVRDTVSSMLGCQVHRGPDDHGLDVLDLQHGAVGLGQRRLSIIDLSAAGHQPMRNPRNGDVLVYNGELYNFQSIRQRLEGLGYQFRGHSDTEVMLYALEQWGVEAIKEFAGMYAVAWWDAKQQRLVLIRDPLGIKPLYVVTKPGMLAFSSEVRPLLSAGIASPELDRAGLAGFFAYGSVQHPLTFYKNVRSFPAGCWQEFRLTPEGVVAGRIERHWDFPEIDPSLDEARVVAQLGPLMDQSVREHLISDVPIGLFLSSGLDSTIMAGLASKHTPRLRTFTVGFPDTPHLSESDVAQETARTLHVDHTDIALNGQDALNAAIPWLESQDQPSMDGLNTYVISKAVRERGIIVAISGLGGDELFGGYHTFSETPKIRRVLRAIAWMPRSLRSAAIGAMLSRKPPDVRSKLMDMFSGNASMYRLAQYRRRVMSDDQMERMGLTARELGLDETFVHESAAARAIEGTSKMDDIAAISRFESLFYMSNTLLRDSDNMGMAHSLEIRVPMLDRRVLDLAFAVPGGVRLPQRLANKHLLRKAFSAHLSEALVKRRKMGFLFPLAKWMAGPMRELTESSIAAIKQAGIVENKEVDAIWSRFLAAPDSQAWSRAYLFLVLGYYLQKQQRQPAPNRHQPAGLRAGRAIAV